MNKNNKTLAYHDGAEQFLLDFFSKKTEFELRDKIDDLLSENNDWAITYHLSEQRKQLIDWIELPRNSRLLEIGAGCGALTGYYCDHVEKVTANELEDDRAEVIRRRWADKKNLSVVQKNIMEMSDESYDILSIIGVLEYSGKFIKSESPYLDFLKKARALLNKNGQMVLAIENKLGLKYFTGCAEDHLGKQFESLNDYPINMGVRTFSKDGLSVLLHDAGFSELSFYYPYPDYKLPRCIVSDEFISGKTHLIPSQFFNSSDYLRDKIPQIDENALGSELVKNQILQFFSNSFLVIAQT